MNRTTQFCQNDKLLTKLNRCNENQPTDFFVTKNTHAITSHAYNTRPLVPCTSRVHGRNIFLAELYNTEMRMVSVGRRSRLQVEDSQLSVRMVSVYLCASRAPSVRTLMAPNAQPHSVLNDGHELPLRRSLPFR